MGLLQLGGAGTRIALARCPLHAEGERVTATAERLFSRR